jgi:putative RecB family exonuclease
LFDLPAAERTLAAAAALVEPEWRRLLAAEPELGVLFEDDQDGGGQASWLASAVSLLEGYFALEDPGRLEPHERESRAEVVLDDGLQLRGVLDRLDRAPTGQIRVVDYKTGTAPGESFEAGALFQMKFYALVIWRTRGVIPSELRLLYLGDRITLRYRPEEQDLLAVERKLRALWAAIRRATETGDWRPRPSRLCEWCDHQSRCPAFGGTPPPLPAAATAAD